MSSSTKIKEAYTHASSFFDDILTELSYKQRVVAFKALARKTREHTRFNKLKNF